MNVVIYTPILYPWVLDLKNALEKEVDEVSAYTTGIFGNYPEWKKLEGQITVIPHRVLLGDRIPKTGFYFRLFRDPPDFFILSGTETTGSMVIAIMARLKRVPALLIVEENMDVRRFYSLPLRVIGGFKRILISSVHRSADILLPETRASRKYLIEMGCKCGNARVAPHGIDTSVFKPGYRDLEFAERIGIDKEELRNKLCILYAGGFNKHKGIEVVVKLLERNLIDDNMLLVIPVFGKLQRQYKKGLVKYKSVKLIPQLGFEDMRKMYSLADVVLVPSIVAGDTERSPNIIIEAMASGKTVVASDIGGIPTIMGEAGILVKQNDARTIGLRLQELAGNRKLLKRYGRLARDQALKNLNIEKYANTILEEYCSYMRFEDEGR